jgi:hypothetical protein
VSGIKGPPAHADGSDWERRRLACRLTVENLSNPARLSPLFAGGPPAFPALFYCDQLYTEDQSQW